MVEIKMEVLPFPVPDKVFVKQKPGTRQEGFKQNPGIPLDELDAEALNDLCKQFREAVFEKAKLLDPYFR